MVKGKGEGKGKGTAGASESENADTEPALPSVSMSNAGGPSDIPGKRCYRSTSGNRIDIPDGIDLVFTTVPSQPLNLPKSTNEDGRTECILINPKIKRAIFTYPGFPDLVPRPRRKMYTIQDTSHMGLGMFAACDIKMGELILAERPLLFAPAFIIFGTSDSLPSHYTEEQTMQKMLVAWENEVSRAVSRMLPDDRAAYLALANCHKEDGSGPLFGIIQTNCFEVGDYRQDNNDHFGTHSAVCKDMSRANHSCCPNATRIFDPASFSMILSAARDIAKGDQIFVTYTDPVLPAEERAKNLALFGIERCQCPACADSLASDRRRHMLDQYSESWVIELMKTWQTDGNLASDYAMQRLLVAISMFEREGLEYHPYYTMLLFVAGYLYGMLGKLTAFMLYSQRASALAIANRLDLEVIAAQLFPSVVLPERFK